MTPEQAAIAVGATQLGDPAHYILTAEQLAALVELLARPLLLPPPY